MISPKSRLSETTLFTIFAVLAVSIFIIANFFIPFSLPLYIFSLVFASLFIFKKPEVGLFAIVALTFIFERFFTLEPLVWGEYTYKIYPLDILTIITGLSFLFYKLRFPKTKILIGKLGSAILMFVSFAAIATAYGIARGGETDLALSTFKNYALYSVFFFLTINIIREKEQLKRFVNLFLVLGFFLFVFIFIGFVRGAGLWIEYTPLSTLGTRLLAPTHAFYLSIVCLLSLNLLAFRKNIFRQFAVPIILVQFLGIIGSLTRHLWLALAFGIVFSFIFLSKKYKKKLLKILAVQILFIFILITLYGWFSYILTGEVPVIGAEYIKSTFLRFKAFTLTPTDESAYFRLFAWQKAWELFKKNPALGIGFGHRLTFDFFGWPTRIEVRELHNDFIGIALQMGIVGFLSFIALNVVFLAQALGLVKKVKEDLGPYCLGFLGCYVLFMVATAFGTYFDINLLVIFFWIFLGTVISIKNIAEKQQ